MGTSMNIIFEYIGYTREDFQSAKQDIGATRFGFALKHQLATFVDKGTLL